MLSLLLPKNQYTKTDEIKAQDWWGGTMTCHFEANYGTGTDKLNPQQRIRYHVRRLQELGQEVELLPMADAA